MELLTPELGLIFWIILILMLTALILPIICLNSFLSKEYNGNDKIIWVFVVIFIPIIGSILYLFKTQLNRIKKEHERTTSSDILSRWCRLKQPTYVEQEIQSSFNISAFRSHTVKSLNTENSKSNFNTSNKMMEFIKSMHLIFIVFGTILLSISLHLKKENTELKYGAIFGYAENLTVQGKIYFFIGLFLAIFGAITGSTMWFY